MFSGKWMWKKNCIILVFVFLVVIFFLVCVVLMVLLMIEKMCKNNLDMIENGILLCISV